MSVALPLAGGGELSVAGLQVLGHLLFEDFLEDGLYALADPSFDVQLHGLLELIVMGQVFLLTQPTKYQTLSDGLAR